MRQPILIAIAICLAGGACTQAVSSPTSRYLYDDCDDTAEVLGSGYCVGLLDGFLVGTGLSSTRAWAIPYETTHEEVLRAYRSWMDAHPQFFDERWPYTFFAAMVESFPSENAVKNVAVERVEENLGISLKIGGD